MIIWGGLDPFFLLGTGGRYNPSNDSWTATTTTDAPTARWAHTAVWTGSEMIVWGGDAVSTPTARPQLADQPDAIENTGGRYCAAAPSPTPTPTPTPSPTPTGTPTCSPGPLWYNGDFNGVNGLSNEQNTIVSQSSIYDNFIVPSPGWHVTGVFSDNLENITVTGATWEIRSGVSEGNGGTLIASGMTATPVVTPTGRGTFNFPEFMIEVTGLSVDLAPGIYWLNVTPIGNGGGRSFDSDTSGTNCVGLPCGNDDNAFINSTTFGFVFHNTSSGDIGQPDFSMGVNGTTGCGTPSPTPTATATATDYAYRHSHSHIYFNGDSNSYAYFYIETFTDAETGH